MHREIQIKQFPIVTTHWWPKTRNERFVWENEQYLYRFLPLVHNHVQVIWVRTRIQCVTCVFARSGSRCIHTGRRRQCLTEGVSEAWCWRNFSSANGGVSQSDRLMQIPNPVHATPEKYVIGCCNYDGASAPRFRHALRQALTLVSCLRPSMCSYDGELFNLDFSVHVLFPSYRDSDLYLPLYDWQTRTVWPKNIKIGSTEEKKTPTSWMPLG